MFFPAAVRLPGKTCFHFIGIDLWCFQAAPPLSGKEKIPVNRGHHALMPNGPLAVISFVEIVIRSCAIERVCEAAPCHRIKIACGD